jgi:predicted porin
LALGAVYWLSKRTTFYGTYSNLSNKGGASFIVGSFSHVAGGARRPISIRRAPSSA